MLPILISNNQNYKKCKFANITHNKLQGIEEQIRLCQHNHRASKVKLQKFSFNNLILSY